MQWDSPSSAQFCNSLSIPSAPTASTWSLHGRFPPLSSLSQLLQVQLQLISTAGSALAALRDFVKVTPACKTTDWCFSTLQKAAVSAHTAYLQQQSPSSLLCFPTSAATSSPCPILPDCSFTFPAVGSWPIQLVSPSRSRQRAFSLHNILSCRLLKQPCHPTPGRWGFLLPQPWANHTGSIIMP